ncbi:uncharacterized protein BKA78DRAFT_105874 [Phyllosticta capitalensis]|uniref:uncharacterized protein n=1 Tax=Phyllosticta capitalensis TaxID=121624 RepID=UPI00312EDE0A
MRLLARLPRDAVGGRERALESQDGRGEAVQLRRAGVDEVGGGGGGVVVGGGDVVLVVVAVVAAGVQVHVVAAAVLRMRMRTRHRRGETSNSNSSSQSHTHILSISATCRRCCAIHHAALILSEGVCSFCGLPTNGIPAAVRRLLCTRSCGREGEREGAQERRRVLLSQPASQSVRRSSKGRRGRAQCEDRRQVSRRCRELLAGGRTHALSQCHCPTFRDGWELGTARCSARPGFCCWVSRGFRRAGSFVGDGEQLRIVCGGKGRVLRGQCFLRSFRASSTSDAGAGEGSAARREVAAGARRVSEVLAAVSVTSEVVGELGFLEGGVARCAVV